MKSGKRLIAVFSGNRAEYGLLSPILRAVKEHNCLDYRLIISGAHLDENFGLTKEEIRSDGYDIHAEVNLDMDGDGSAVTPRAIASGILGLTPILQDIQPDLLVVYADRFEGFSAVIAGTQMNIPTAHIEGGDVTEGGALDDSVRHAMTKLAHLHYTTNEQAANRVLSMGEEPWRVHTVGFPALDLINDNAFANEEELMDRFSLDSSKPVVLFTQHSITTEYQEAARQLSHSIDALCRIAKEKVRVLITYPNNDAGGEIITEALEQFDGEGHPYITIHKSLGRHNYHGLLALARFPEWRIACVGNSSSGIKETPAFGCPTVNIGTRQQSRLRGENVIDTEHDSESIYTAIHRCLYHEEFRALCKETPNPYGGGSAGKLIAENLASVDLNPKIILRKRMLLNGECKDGWFR